MQHIKDACLCSVTKNTCCYHSYKTLLEQLKKDKYAVLSYGVCQNLRGSSYQDLKDTLTRLPMPKIELAELEIKDYYKWTNFPFTNRAYDEGSIWAPEPVAHTLNSLYTFLEYHYIPVSLLNSILLGYRHTLDKVLLHKWYTKVYPLSEKEPMAIPNYDWSVVFKVLSFEAPKLWVRDFGEDYYFIDKKHLTMKYRKKFIPFDLDMAKAIQSELTLKGKLTKYEQEIYNNIKSIVKNTEE